MSIIHSTTRYLTGMQHIERAITGALRDAGNDAAAPNFRWHRGENRLPPPEATTLEAVLRGRTWNAALSRDQIDSCSGRVERADVVLLVNDAVDKLSGRERP